MKFIITGDWHLRAQRPQNRKDRDYFVTQMGKVEQILQLAKEHDAPILQPGDFFDGVDVPWFVVKAYIDLFREYDVKTYCVRGQHDLRYHSKKVDNTPLAVMEASEVVRVLGEEEWPKANVRIVGQSWGEPEDEDLNRVLEITKGRSNCNIFILHCMVIEEKLWAGQEDFIYAKHLFREYPAVDLFVCGDNHTSFLVKDRDRYVVNCGSLMRSSIDQANHVPIVYVYDTDDRTLDPHIIKVRKPGDVLDIKRAKEEDKRDKDLQAFVEGLGEDKDLGLDFLENLRVRMIEGKVGSGVKGIIEEALDRVQGEESR